MTALDTLPAGQWTPIARRVRVGEMDEWSYHVGTHEGVVAEREAGRLVTALRRVGEGFELVGWRRD